jgi:hypothetical protein
MLKRQAHRNVLFALTLACAPLVSCERPAAVNEPGPDCEAEKVELVRLVETLPERAMAREIRVKLPSSTLGGGLGPAPILEISEGWVALDGVAIEGTTHEQTIARLQQRLGELPQPTEPVANPAPEAGTASFDPHTLYIAAAADTDVSTLQMYLRALPAATSPKLLFGAPSLADDPSLSGNDVAARMFAERDPKKRAALAKEAYAATASCQAVAEVARSVDGVTGEERWPKVRTGMLGALPSCACAELDAENLGSVLLAEQRSSGSAIGSLAIDFLSDDRCPAAMPLRSVQQLLGDVEKFEEEFSGQWQGDALSFEQILTNDRLLVYLCGALPGETLAFLQQARRTIWFKTTQGCTPLGFAPLSRDAPMGTLRRVTPGASGVALHYRQFSEEIRLFGPVPNAESRPTDEGPWACTQDFHMTQVDASSIALESGGRWFFDEETCRTAPAADQFPAGCVSELVNGN